MARNFCVFTNWEQIAWYQWRKGRLFIRQTYEN